MPEQLGERGVHRRERLLEVEHAEAERRPLEALAVALLGLDALVLGLRRSVMSRMLATQPPTAGTSCMSVSTSSTQQYEPSARAEAPLDRRGPDAPHGVVDDVVAMRVDDRRGG